MTVADPSPTTGGRERAPHYDPPRLGDGLPHRSLHGPPPIRPYFTYYGPTYFLTDRNGLSLETMNTISVLHVDDDPDFADLVATFLEREREEIAVVTETDPHDARERFAAESGVSTVS